MSLVATEQVLVVPTRLFHEIGHFQGFSRDTGRYLPRLFDPEHLSYRPRSDMEQDPSFKQLIPYVLFRYVDTDGTVLLFDYLRGTGLGERRLHAKRSVGVGGHVSTLDAEAADHHDAVYREGLERELAEEVIIDTPYREECVGLINDDETEVGKVHLGVVHLFDVETPDVRPREADMLEAGFRPVEEILAELDRFESWSQIAVSALFGR
ncbi:MAG: phosphoesterase [Pirellulales bacterium]